jgi:glycosyltransferase involved in cell wall biosynthesis
MREDVVHILLATYNGERFIREQLDSLLQQTSKHFKVLIRDDGSNDHTSNIIADYQSRHPTVFEWIKDDIKNERGATGNFALLLEYSNADYIFFCDQDDVWLPDKMSRELQKIKSIEDEKREQPCMIFSDMKAIDEAGTVISNSVWSDLHLHPRYFSLNRLLVQNIPHGCTMLINRAMRNLACPVPQEALLHDHWIALIAAACGNWDDMHEPTVLLRNHGENVTRKKMSASDKAKRYTGNLISKEAYEYFIRIRADQAEALLKRCGLLLDERQKRMLNDFISLRDGIGWRRKKLMLRHKFFRTTLLHTLKMIARA